MAVTKFKPTIWEGALLSQFHAASIAEAMMTKPKEKKGEKVIFSFTKDGNIKDYNGTVNWDDIDATEKELIFDKQKYFAIKLDDVDAVQTKSDLLLPTTAEHAFALAEQFDKDFFAALATGGSLTIGKSNKKVRITSQNAYDMIVDIATELNKQKVPKMDRFVTVSADMLGLLAKDRRFTPNPVVLTNGFVEGKKIAGLQVMTSEELPENTIIGHHKSAIGGDKQIDKTEAMRLENSFSDGVRGLMKYGFIRLRDKAVVVLHWELGAEPDPIGVVVKNETTNPVNTKAV